MTLLRQLELPVMVKAVKHLLLVVETAQRELLDKLLGSGSLVMFTSQGDKQVSFYHPLYMYTYSKEFKADLKPVLCIQGL